MADLNNELIEALKSENLQEVHNLLDKGADVNAKDNKGWTALMHAAYCGNDEIAELLINKIVDINAKNNDGWTALMHAAEFGDKEIAKILIKKGANLNAKDNKGQTAMDIARHNKYSGIPELLEKGRSNINNLSMKNSNAVNKLINGEKGWKMIYENASGNWPEGTYDNISTYNILVGSILVLPIIFSPMIYFRDLFLNNGNNIVSNFMNGGFIPIIITAIFVLGFLVFLFKTIIPLYLKSRYKSESKVYRGEVDEISSYTRKGTTTYVLKSGELEWRIHKSIYSKVDKEDFIIAEYNTYAPMILKLMVKHHE